MAHSQSNPLDRFIRRAAKKAPDALRNAPLFMLTGIVSLCIEVFAFGGILAHNTSTIDVAGHPIRLAYAEAVMSASMTLVALVLAGAAAAQKSDPRPEQRRRAWATQLLAIAVLTAPIYYSGNCVAMNAQNAWRDAYVGSDQHQADLRDSEDDMMDSIARRQAANRLERANEVTYAKLDFLLPGMAWMGFLLGCNMLAVRFGWRAKPETKTQRDRRTRPNNVTPLKGVA